MQQETNLSETTAESPHATRGEDAVDFYLSADKRFRFIEKHPHERGFSAHFAKNVYPRLLELEASRLKKVKQLMLRATGALVAVLVLLEFFVSPTAALSPLLYIVGMSGAIAWAYWPFRDYRSNYKNIILPEVVSFFGLSYKEDGKIDPAVLSDSDIMPSFSHYASEDMIWGSHQGVKMAITEVRTEKKEPNTPKPTRFSGLFVFAELPRSFAGKTLIIKEMGMGTQSFQKIDGKQEVTLNSPKYSRRFKVYSTATGEASDLVNTNMLEGLMAISARFRNTTVACSLYGNKLFMTIPCQENLFEPAPLFVPAYNVSDLRLLIEEIHLLFQFIDNILSPQSPATVNG